MTSTLNERSNPFRAARLPQPIRGKSMTRYRWARWGDVNAFFGLILDNVAVMIVLVVLVTSAEPGRRAPLFAGVRADADDPRHGPGRRARRPGLYLDGVPPGPANRPVRRDRHAVGAGHAEHVRRRAAGAAAGPERRHGPVRAGPRPGDGLRLARRRPWSW